MSDPSMRENSETRVPVSAIIQFARFWSTNMDMIHSKGTTWPGFGYTDDEKAQMHAISEKYSFGQFLLSVVVVACLTIIVAAAGIGLMFYHLNGKYGSDPSKTPAVEFFFCLASVAVGTLAGGLPLSILLTSALMGRIFPALSNELPEQGLSEHLAFKATRQIIRMTILLSSLVMIFWIFVPNDSKIVLFLNIVVPVLAPIVSGLTALYYFGGRIQSQRQK